ncbi:hypothetical protein Q7P37_009736 [Cladosporium fusiforme]
MRVALKVKASLSDSDDSIDGATMCATEGLTHGSSQMVFTHGLGWTKSEIEVLSSDNSDNLSNIAVHLLRVRRSDHRITHSHVAGVNAQIFTTECQSGSLPTAARECTQESHMYGVNVPRSRREAPILAIIVLKVRRGAEMDILTLVAPSGEKCCLPWERFEPLIATYIRDRAHKQQFIDGDFTLTNSAGLTISPAVWPTGLLPGTEAFLRIGTHEAYVDHNPAEAHLPSRMIQDHIERACSHIARKLEGALSRLEEIDRRVDALQRTGDALIQGRHQDQDLQRRQEEALKEAQRGAQDRDRELERDRRDRERESERDRRQRERENNQDVMERGRPLFGNTRSRVRSCSADLAIGTDLRALKEQVGEIATTLSRAYGEGIALNQNVVNTNLM